LRVVASGRKAVAVGQFHVRYHAPQIAEVVGELVVLLFQGAGEVKERGAKIGGMGGDASICGVEIPHGFNSLLQRMIWQAWRLFLLTQFLEHTFGVRVFRVKFE